MLIIRTDCTSIRCMLDEELLAGDELAELLDDMRPVTSTSWPTCCRSWLSWPSSTNVEPAALVLAWLLEVELEEDAPGVVLDVLDAVPGGLIRAPVSMN